MCYGFEAKIEAAILVQQLLERKYNIDASALMGLIKKENIRPKDKIMCMYKEGNKLQISLINWGIQFSKDKPLIANSRTETIKEKPFWNSLFAKNSCLVPMTSFYEWITIGTKKVQHKIYIYNEEYFFVPGILYEDKEKKLSVSIITTAPNKFIEPFHNRMPVLLTLDEAVEFMSEDPDKRIKKLNPYRDNESMRKEILILNQESKPIKMMKK